MKDVFEKIKERLEEKAHQSWLVQAERNGYERSIEIVNQVAEECKMGDVSDGYHTFDELYHHRAILFSVICNSNKELAWKSKLHDTGDMYDGMFIVGIETPEGQATYHYDIEPYWDMFEVKELPKAPKWDGHTPDEAIRRISLLDVPEINVGEIEEFCEWRNNGIADEWNPSCEKGTYNVFGVAWFKRCPYCGKKIKVVE